MVTNVTYWLDKSAEHFPDKVAFVDENNEYTFRELQKKAKAIATCILEQRVFREPIIIYMDKCVHTLAAFMGVAYSGNFYSLIDVDMPVNRIDKIVEVLQPALVITTKQYKIGFEACNYNGEFLLFEDVDVTKINECGILDIKRKLIDTDLLYVLFTSGSTGIPKGVTITHRSVIEHIDCVTEIFGITEKDSFGNQVPFYFDMSILDIYSTIKCGATTYIIPKRLFSFPILLLEYLKNNKINTIYWVPSAMTGVSRLNALQEVDLTEVLNRVLFAGEVMPNKQLNNWRKFLPNALYANLYGPTEITNTCVYYIVDREFSNEEALPIGVPMANTDILVLNENDELVTGDEIGELCVRGSSLSMGYYNEWEKTKVSFVQNPLNPHVPETIYRTGDLVRYNEYGEMIYLSRKDSQIKHLGRRIELGEIEKAVASLEEVSLCCCLYNNMHQQIVLFVEGMIKKSDVNSRIAKLIPSYMLPHKVISLKDMPINANGKIDRAALEEML